MTWPVARSIARHVRHAAFLDEHEDGLAVRREDGLRVVELGAGGPCDRAALDIHDRERPGLVVDPLVFAGLRVRDLPAVGTPGERRLEVRVVVRALEARDLLLRRAFARLDHVDVGIQVAIRIGAALGDVGDALAVRRPGGQALVVPTCGQLRRLAAADVEEPEVFALVGQEAGEVLLEVVAVDHDRPRLRRFFFALGTSRDRSRSRRAFFRPATRQSPRLRPGKT